jgi:hypothetical protein
MKNEILDNHFASLDLSFLNQYLDKPIIEKPKTKVNGKDYLPIEKPKDWSEEIKELETYFNSMTPPTEPIILDQCTTITDCSKFIESHLAVARANNGNKTFRPYLERLIEFKNIMIDLQ